MLKFICLVGRFYVCIKAHEKKVKAKKARRCRQKNYDGMDATTTATAAGTTKYPRGKQHSTDTPIQAGRHLAPATNRPAGHSVRHNLTNLLPKATDRWSYIQSANHPTSQPAIQPTAIAATVYRQRKDQWAHAPIDIYDNRKDEDGDYDDEMFSRFYFFFPAVAAAAAGRHSCSCLAAQTWVLFSNSCPLDFLLIIIQHRIAF